MNNTIINWDETLTLCNNNQALALELVTMLKADLPLQKQIFIDAYDREDWRTLRDIVHQILGSCSYIALPQLKESAQNIHMAIHNKKADLKQERQAIIQAIDNAIVLPIKQFDS